LFGERSREGLYSFGVAEQQLEVVPAVAVVARLKLEVPALKIEPRRQSFPMGRRERLLCLQMQ
jgi:hypothetical protein